VTGAVRNRPLAAVDVEIRDLQLLSFALMAGAAATDRQLPTPSAASYRPQADMSKLLIPRAQPIVF